MPYIKYVDKKFRRAALETIAQADQILRELAAEGYDVTVRQLYYQFVSRALIENSDKEYTRIKNLISDARLAGLIDWDHIIDRTRNLRRLPAWTDGVDLLESAADQFRIDLWEGQSCRPEVWIEKDALVGVIAGVCNELRVPYFSCRGYTSQSEMWAAAQRMRRYAEAPIVFHLGDHDPSGIDMTRDIADRLTLFGANVEVVRIALNRTQIDRYNPPPNPAKLSDSRSQAYVALHGYESWELDALEPRVIDELIRSAIASIRDDAEWNEREEQENAERQKLTRVAEEWGEL